MHVILGTAHGYNVAGKQSPDGKLKEYQWSREMCLMIKNRLLNEGIDCSIDIESDFEKSVTNRISIVNSISKKYNKNCIYVSIHINAAGKGNKWYNANGWTVWVCENCSEKSKDLALSLFNEADKSKLLGNRYIPQTKYMIANYGVLKKTNCPAVLTENMFQDNKNDVDFLLSDEGKQKICEIHVNGIKKFIDNLK